MGMAFKGDVCPKCHSNDYVNTYTVWHGLLAIFWFPVGLIGLAFPIKKCIPCQTTYGVGLQITKIVKILAITGIVFVSLLLLIILTKIL